MELNEGFGNNRKSNINTVNDNNSIISPKIYQDIYHQITGKTEKISKAYKENLLIDFEEVRQLHDKIMQISDVHQVIANSEYIVIYYNSDCKETFTSFSRFEQYNSSKSSITTSLVLKYDFFIKLPNLDKPRSYTITVKLNSRLAAIESILKEAPAFIPYGIVAFMERKSAEINVEYVDYLIAKSFIETFDDWVKCCNSVSPNKLLNFFQSKSRFSSIILQTITGAVLIYSFLTVTSGYSDNFSKTWGRFLILSFISFFFVMKISGFLGNMIERYIDSFYQDSYLKLTRGDEKLIQNSISRKNKTLAKMLIPIILAIVLGVISSKLASYI